MIQVALTPNADGPGALLEEEAVDPLPLRGKHSLNVFRRGLQLFEFLRVGRFYRCGDPALRFAIGLCPSQLGRISARNPKSGGEIPQPEIVGTHRCQSVGGDGHLLQIFAWQPGPIRGQDEGFLDFLLSGSELDLDLQQRQLADGERVVDLT